MVVKKTVYWHLEILYFSIIMKPTRQYPSHSPNWFWQAGPTRKKSKYEINSSNYVVVAVKTKFAHNIMSSYNSWEILGFIHAFEKYSQGFRALAIWILLKFMDLFCFNHTIPSVLPSHQTPLSVRNVNLMFYTTLNPLSLKL